MKIVLNKKKFFFSNIFIFIKILKSMTDKLIKIILKINMKKKILFFYK